MGNTPSIVNKSTMDSVNQFPNCSFYNDKAYTEDGIVVYNVFVWNIPRYTSESELFEYFQKFGDIASVHLANGHNKEVDNQKLISGCVYYKDPVSAAKVLKTKVHSIEGNPIYVAACNSLNQPGGGQPDKDDKDSYSWNATAYDDINTSDISLLNLSDNCLEMIFNRMKMMDQVNLASSCCRLRDLFVMRAKIDCKTLNLNQLEFGTQWQIRTFLELVGLHIEKIRGYVPPFNFESAIELLGIYCINVTSISITCESLTGRSLQKLLRNMHRVEELHLRCFQLQDESITVLKNLKRLKTLSLDENYYLSGRKIKYLTTVESLSLFGCKAIMPSHFKDICENLKDLKYLDIQRCLALQTPSMQHICKYLHKLETIKLSCNNDPNGFIASHHNLKNLHLYESLCGPESPQIFHELAKRKADQLEILAIYSHNFVDLEMSASIGKLRNLKQLICPNNDNLDDNCLHYLSKLEELNYLDIQNCNGFTARGLLDLIQKCRNLKTLDVSRCLQIDEDFSKNVLALYKSERKQRNQNNPLKIFAFHLAIPILTINISAHSEESDDIWLITF